jgi:hypothetical protein
MTQMKNLDEGALKGISQLQSPEAEEEADDEGDGQEYEFHTQPVASTKFELEEKIHDDDYESSDMKMTTVESIDKCYTDKEFIGFINSSRCKEMRLKVVIRLEKYVEKSDNSLK